MAAVLPAACDVNVIRPSTNCLLCLDSKQRLSAEVFYLCKAMAALDATQNCDIDSLMEDSKCCPCVDKDMRELSDIYIAWSAANSAGSPQAWLSAADLLEEIKAFTAVDTDRLKCIKMQLNCLIVRYISAVLPT